MQIVTGDEEAAFTGHDRLSAFMLGRMQVIEACLMLMANKSGEFDALKKSVSQLIETMEKVSTAHEQEKAAVAHMSRCTDKDLAPSAGRPLLLSVADAWQHIQSGPIPRLHSSLGVLR